MTQFTKSFLWRFILDVILLGIFVRLLQSVILAILSRTMENYSTTQFLIVEAVVVSAISMLFVCFIKHWNIGVISKKGCYDYQMDSDKWFRNFSIIIIGINLISTIISFIVVNKYYRNLTQRERFVKFVNHYINENNNYLDAFDEFNDYAYDSVDAYIAYSNVYNGEPIIIFGKELITNPIIPNLTTEVAHGASQAFVGGCCTPQKHTPNKKEPDTRKR